MMSEPFAENEMSESAQLLLHHIALLIKVQNIKLENINIVVSCFGLLVMVNVPDIIKPLLSLAVNFDARCCICTVCTKHAWVRNLSESDTHPHCRRITFSSNASIYLFRTAVRNTHQIEYGFF